MPRLNYVEKIILETVAESLAKRTTDKKFDSVEEWTEYLFNDACEKNNLFFINDEPIKIHDKPGMIRLLLKCDVSRKILEDKFKEGIK